jgi:hypothetical protein
MDNIIKFMEQLGPVVVVLTFIKITWEYIKGQKWKKSELLSKEIKDFFNDDNIKMVCAMLDWNARKIEIDGKVVLITDDVLCESLKTHNEKGKFSEVEARLRDIFDHFFDKISYFNIHIENGLVSQKEVLTYLSYYLHILSKPGRKPKKLVKVFQNYITYYGFTNVEQLIEKSNQKK